MNKRATRPAFPLIIIFIIFSAFFITGRHWLVRKGVDPDVLIVGNLLLFVVSITAFYLAYRSFPNANPNAFVRAMYGGFMVKFFVLAIVAFIYIMMNRQHLNKPALVACAGLYIIYTGIETRALTKILRERKNG